MAASSSRSVRRKISVDPLPVLMVEEHHALLKDWHQELTFNENEIIKLRIGNLLHIIDRNLVPRRDLICAMLRFWVPTCNTFRFGDFEMTPTLEELAGYVGLELENTRFISPGKVDKFDFFQNLKLHTNPTIKSLDKGWIDLKYLFDRFGAKGGFEMHRAEFYDTLSFDQWVALRPQAFALAFLGLVVFPKKKRRISIQISAVVRSLFGELKGATIVPMILGSLYRALTKAQSGEEKFFSGCNLWLQVWFMEHLCPHPPVSPIMPWVHAPLSYRSPLLYHSTDIQGLLFPETEGEWVAFLRSATSEMILWQYMWFPFVKVVTGCLNRPFLVLMGLLGAQPYAPVRVLRQLGRPQDIPRVEDMSAFSYDFGDDEPFKRRQLWAMWDTKTWASEETQVIDRFRGNFTSSYQAWYKSQPQLVVKPPRSGQGEYDLQASFEMKLCLATQNFKQQSRQDYQQLKKVQAQSKQKAERGSLAISALQEKFEATVREREYFAEKAQKQARIIEAVQERLNYYKGRYSEVQELVQEKSQRIDELRQDRDIVYHHSEELVGVIETQRLRLFHTDLAIDAAQDVVHRSTRRLFDAWVLGRNSTFEEIGRHAPLLVSDISRDFQELRQVFADIPQEEEEE